MACGVSVAASTRVQIRVTASTAALTSSMADSQRHNSPPGCSMTITPRKPTIVLVMRRQPTRSPSSGMASSVIISGATATSA